MDPATILCIVLGVAAGAGVVYAVKAMIEQIDWPRLKSAVKTAYDTAKYLIGEGYHIVASVLKKEIAVGFWGSLFGAPGVAFYSIVSVVHKVNKILFYEKTNEFKSISEIKDSAIQEAVRKSGSWALEAALE